MNMLKPVLAIASTAAMLAGAASISGAAQLVAAPYAASGAAINCTIPNHVECDISSRKGIKSVKITANTPQGTINLVNKTYPNCPKLVTVGWDSAYHSSGKQIVECTPMKLKLAK